MDWKSLTMIRHHQINIKEFFQYLYYSFDVTNDTKLNMLINNDINNLNTAQNRSNECQTLTQLSKKELNKLASLDANTLHNIIKLEDVASDINKILKEFNDDFTLPFSLLFQFKRDVFKYVEFNFYQSEHTITLTFKVPFYKKIRTFQCP